MITTAILSHFSILNIIFYIYKNTTNVEGDSLLNTSFPLEFYKIRYLLTSERFIILEADQFFFSKPLGKILALTESKRILAVTKYYLIYGVHK